MKHSRVKTLIMIHDFFSIEEDIISWENYLTKSINKANTKAQSEWLKKFNDWKDQSLIDLAEELIYRTKATFDIDQSNRERLIRFLAEALIEDRPIQAYFDKVKASYVELVEKAMHKLLVSPDMDLFAWSNYEDGIESHYVCTNAKRLESITDGDVHEIGKILDGNHSHLTFKGRKDGFSNAVKLYLRLRS
ncbi:MAG: hypothetical protein KKH92_00365 [Firmicutes bacterium]|nr:hypothetical protein [Bacillota bacterium]